MQTGYCHILVSLNQAERLKMADFMVYSAFTTVARRLDTTWSWTENQPYEPEVGNVPTTNNFIHVDVGKVLFHLPGLRRDVSVTVRSCRSGALTSSACPSAVE